MRGFGSAPWRGSWRIALRLARRDALRNKGRTTLVAAMVGLPVMLVVALSTLVHTSDISPREALTSTLGHGQALVTTTGDTREPVLQNPREPGWSNPPNAQPGPSRPWTVNQLQQLTGGRLIPIWKGSTRVGSDGIALPISATELPTTDPATRGMVQLQSGRLPRAPGEIAATQGLLAQTGWKVGSRLTDLDTRAGVTVVGTYSTLGMSRDERDILGVTGSLHDPATDDVSNATYLLVRNTPVTWGQVTRLNQAGLSVQSRAVILHPPAQKSISADQRAAATNDVASQAVVVLVIVSIVIEVVLLAGPAFAVGVRRRRRDLALLAATGGTPRDIRRSVLAQAALVGIGSACAGALLGLPLARLGMPVAEHFGYGLGPFDWRWRELVSALVVGCAAAVLAALAPAIQASRSDVATVLAGRRGVLRSRRGWPLLGVVLVAGGAAVALSKGTRAGGEFWVAGGTIVIVLGAIAATPWLVGQVGRLATRLPLPLRLATRDASRQRARTAPAVAAIMASVIGITALAIGFASDSKQARQDYEPRTATGVATVSLGSESVPEIQGTIRDVLPGRPLFTSYDVQAPSSDAPTDPSDSTTTPTATTAITSQALLLVAPGCTALRAAAFDDASAQACSQIWQAANTSDQIAALDGPALSAYGVRLSAPQQRVLSGGGVLVAEAAALHGQRATLAVVELKADSTPSKVLKQTDLPAALLPFPGPHTSYTASVIMTPQTAQRLGLAMAPTSVAIGGAVLTRAESDRLNGRLTLLDTSVYVERGYHQQYALVLALLALVGGLVVLVGTITATGLAMSEARPDLATLAAIGAPPRTRRYVASGQAMVIGLLGTLLGVALGFVPGLAVTYPLTSTSFSGPGGGGGHGPVISIPWLTLLILVVAVPLLAGLVTGLFTRSRLPMVRRLAT